MSLPADGWKNKAGTGNRSCRCGSWKQHWINATGKSWPKKCFIAGFDNDATLDAHIINLQCTPFLRQLKHKIA